MEPKLYLSVENGTGQLVVDGPLCLFERLLGALREVRTTGPEVERPQEAPTEARAKEVAHAQAQ